MMKKVYRAERCKGQYYIRLSYQILCLLKHENLSFQKKSAAKSFEIGQTDFLGIFTYVSWDPYPPLLVTIFFVINASYMMGSFSKFPQKIKIYGKR